VLKNLAFFLKHFASFEIPKSNSWMYGGGGWIGVSITSPLLQHPVYFFAVVISASQYQAPQYPQTLSILPQ